MYKIIANHILFFQKLSNKIISGPFNNFIRALGLQCYSGLNFKLELFSFFTSNLRSILFCPLNLKTLTLPSPEFGNTLT